MEIIQGVIAGPNGIVRKATALLQTDFPSIFFPDENIIANAVLSFIRVHVFCGYTDEFVYQNVTDFIPSTTCEHLTFHSAFHPLPFRHHLPVVADTILQQGAFIVKHNDQLGTVKTVDLFRLSADELIYLLENIGKLIGICGKGRRCRDGR